MEKRIQLGLVGDFNKNMYTHVAINDAIAHCKPHLAFTLDTVWIGTESIDDNFLANNPFAAFWIAPGSPYMNDEGVYQLIRWCRENNSLLYGTCGGFQYMLVEYARNVLKIASAGHEESEPGSAHLIIHKMACSLRGSTEDVLLADDSSWLARTLAVKKINGHFNCSYGLNPVYQKILDQYPLVFTAFSEHGEPRAFELKAHRFYTATLFQPQLESTRQNPNALVLDFLKRSAQQ